MNSNSSSSTRRFSAPPVPDRAIAKETSHGRRKHVLAVALAALGSLLAPAQALAGDDAWSWWRDYDPNEDILREAACAPVAREPSLSGWACPAWMKGIGGGTYDPSTETCIPNGPWKSVAQAFNSETGVLRPQPVLETTCKQGTPAGPLTIYWPNGKVRERRGYDADGNAHGPYEVNRFDGRPLEKGTLCNPEVGVSAKFKQAVAPCENHVSRMSCFAFALQTQIDAALKGSARGLMIQPELESFACGTSTKYEYLDDGSLSKETEFRDGVQHGKTRTYWPNGKPNELETYADGVLRGPYESYFDDGTMYLKGAACEDKNGSEPWVKCGVGFEMERWPNGVMKSRVNVKDGLLLGDAEYRFESGALLARGKNCAISGTRGLACGTWDVAAADGEPTKPVCYIPAPLSNSDLHIDAEPLRKCPPADGDYTLTSDGPFVGSSVERWTGRIERGTPVGLWTQEGGSGSVCLNRKGQVAEGGETCD